MNAIELFSIVASISSIVLAVVAIVLSVLSDRRSAESHGKTMEALQAIDKRSAITENTVGENFQQMMKTVLSIVQSATADKEVQKAELEAKSAETAAQTQRQLFGMLEEVIKSGDKEKVQNFIEVFRAMTSGIKGVGT
jgi:hypothetical protein